MITALKLRNFDDDGSAPSHDPNQLSSAEVAVLVAKAREEGRIGGYLAGAEDGRNEMRRTMQATQAEMLDSLTQQLAQLAATSAAQQEALVEQIVGFTLQTCEIVFPELIETMSVARVKKTWAVDFPISVLFEAPTVEKVAAQTGRGGRRAPSRFLDDVRDRTQHSQ